MLLTNSGKNLINKANLCYLQYIIFSLLVFGGTEVLIVYILLCYPSEVGFLIFAFFKFGETRNDTKASPVSKKFRLFRETKIC